MRQVPPKVSSLYLEKFRHLYDLPRIRVAEPDPGSQVMRLNRNEKPDNWPKELLDRIYSSIPENLLQRYPDQGPFYAKLSKFLGVPEHSLLITSGVDEAIRGIITLCCEPGDTFAVPWPGYAMYDVYARMFDCRLSPIIYTTDRFMGPEELCARVPAGSKVLFLPNPSQPVENCFDLEELGKIAAYCRDQDIIFAVDEAYHFYGAPSALPLIEDYDNVLVMRSFSKAFGAASLRMGYVAGSPEALTPLSALRLAHEASGLSLHAASVLIECFDSHLKPSIDSICEGRDFLRTRANDSGFPAWGRVSNYVIIDLTSNERMLTATKSLEAQGIYVKGRFPEPLDHHIMVTCGPLPMMDRFFDALLEAVDGR